MYIIELKNQKIHAHIGWGDEERNNGVDLLVSVQVTLDSKVPHDDLYETINYVDILDIVLKESQNELKLLETFSKNIAHHIKRLKAKGISKIVVEIRKPILPVYGYNADYASVLFIDNIK